MSSISKLPKNKINWRISTLSMSKKQEIIVLIIFLWEGKAIDIRNPNGIKGMILPKMFIKATLKLKSLIYVSIVLKGTKPPIPEDKVIERPVYKGEPVEAPKLSDEN